MAWEAALAPLLASLPAHPPASLDTADIDTNIGTSGVRVEPAGEMGLRAVASQSFRAGACVLCESSLLVLPQQFSLGHIGQCLQDADRDAWLPRALQLFHPSDAAFAAEPRWERLRACWRASGHLFAAAGPDAEVLSRLWRVLTLNAFGGGDEKRRTHLFEVGSRVNHSCDPNCCRTVGADGRLIIRAVRPIARGEEIKISYLVPQALLSPAAERNRRLRQYGFACTCSRCSGCDDTRGFCCPSCTAGTVRLPGSVCHSCGSAVAAATLARWEADDERLIERVAELEGAAGPPLALMLQCLRECEEAGMRSQHILARALEMTAQAHASLMQLGRAAVLTARQVLLTQRILPEQPLPAAFLLERLGDLMAGCAQHDTAVVRAPFGASTPSKELIARVYAAAWAGQLRVYTRERPYAAEVERKLNLIENQ